MVKKEKEVKSQAQEVEDRLTRLNIAGNSAAHVKKYLKDAGLLKE